MVWLICHQSECQEEVRSSTREILTEKLENCNGFFTTQLYPPFLKFWSRQRIFVEFPTATWIINFVNTDMRCFKIQTSDTGRPPPPQHTHRPSTLGRATLVIAHWQSIVWWSRKQIIELFCMLNNPMPNRQWPISKVTFIESGIFNLSSVIWLYIIAYFCRIYS